MKGAERFEDLPAYFSRRSSSVRVFPPFIHHDEFARVRQMQMRKLPFALLVFCCIDTAAGFRAAHVALPVQQKCARCTPLQLCTTPARRGSNRAARPWLAAAVVAGSVVAMPTFALASATSTGEHLHLGQKIALVFKRTGLPDWAVLLLISI